MKAPVPESSQIHDKFIPVPDYIIPQTSSGDDANCRIVKRKNNQDISRDILTYPDPIYRFPPKPTKIPLQEISRKLMDFNTDINTNFEENFPFQEGVISETYQRLYRSHFQEPPEWIVLLAQAS